MKILNFSIVFILFSLSSCSQYKVDPTQQKIVDQYGRIAIFHGVNVIYKTFPYYPITDHYDSNSSLCDEDLQHLVDWGFNMIRLYVAWQGVEPSLGQYNYTYIEELRKIVRMCAKYNISVLLDAHQDLLSNKFCGEGFPLWAFNKSDSFPAPLPFSIPVDAEGLPNISYCLRHDFAEYYFTYDIQNAFEQLYLNYNGLADAMGDMWAIVAQYFKDEPNVIGYELLNEPFAANMYSNYEYMADPSLNDVDHLMPFYKLLNDKIRAVDNETIIFFEPTVDDLLTIDLTEGPGGPEYNDRQVFSYHIYCPDVNNLGEPYSAAICQSFDNMFIESRVQAAKAIGVPGFLTEFGALSNSNSSVKEVDFITGLVEQRFESWVYWQFKYYNDITTIANPGTTESFYFNNGTLQSNKVIALSRPYAYAICGNPVYTSFDPKMHIFDFSFAPSYNCSGQSTELYLSEEFYYSNGLDIEIEGCSGCSLNKNLQSKRFVLYVPPGMNSNDNIITIKINSIENITVIG